MNKIDKLEEEDSVIKDGQTLRVSMFMMDSLARVVVADTASTVGHKPGSLPITDADRASREEIYARRDQKMTDAWKNPSPLDPSQTKKAITPAPSADRYAARDARLEQAWRSA